MDIVELKCPNCDAPRPIEQANKTYECRFCHARWVLSPKTTTSTPSPKQPAEKPGLGKTANIVAVVLGVLIAIPIVLFRIQDADEVAEDMQTERGSSSSMQQVALPKAVSAKPAAPPKAELSYVGEGGGPGRQFWIAEYKNVGQVAIERPRLAVSLFDKDGKRLAEQSGHSPRNILAPGESTHILALLTDAPKFERAEVKVVSPKAPRYASPDIAMEVRDVRVAGRGEMHKNVTGTVKNPTNAKVRFVEVQVVGRNNEGKPVSIASGYVTATDLEPGEESGFKVSIGTFEIEEAVEYDVLSFGQP